MSKQITVRWDTSQEEVDDEEFEIIKMMVGEAGGKESLGSLRVVVADLTQQGYDKTRAMKLCQLARGSLRYPGEVTITP